MRVGLVGLGVMGRNHLRVLGDLPGVEVAAVSDPVDAAILATREAVFPRWGLVAEPDLWF